jgi:threonyl-tRNA synthetase
MKVPLMIILGGKEEENNVVSLRYRSGEELRNLDISDIVTALNNNIIKRDSNIKLELNA